MAKFFSRCFPNFEVAFWNSKIAMYMEEIVPTMLNRLKKNSKFVLSFVWS